MTSPSMKQIIHRIIDVDFTVTSVNRATLRVRGEASTPGWTGEELSNDRVGDGILHLDLVAQPPPEIVPQVITAITVSRIMNLGSQPQDVTVHSATNEMSVTLPVGGDPP